MTGVVRSLVVAALHLAATVTANFTRVPQDVWATEGGDVAMTCEYSARVPAAGVSIEMQWWHLRDVTKTPAPAAAVGAGRAPHSPARLQLSKTVEATKISTVRVVGTNLLNTLRLSSVGRGDAGRYECRVSDRGRARAQEHKASATLHVGPTRSPAARALAVPEARPLIKSAVPVSPPGAGVTARSRHGDQRPGVQPSPTPAGGQPQQQRDSGGWRPTVGLLLTLPLIAALL